MNYTKSYLQWAGGKNKGLPHLLPILDKHKQPTFVEPFIGAANVSLNFDAETYIWNDLNEDLCMSHSTLLGSESLLEAYLKSCEEMFEAGFESYYDLRDEFNAPSPSGDGTYRPALFQYLNKHGFNGLMRYNKSGGFNTTRGSVTKNKKVVPVDSIKAFRNRFLNNTTLHSMGFEEVFARVEKTLGSSDTLIYSDPPYVPAGGSDFNYTADGFSYEDHVKLRDLSKHSKCTAIISNHWNDITEELYKDADEIYTFPVQRTISCKGEGREKVEECVVIYT